MTSPTIIEMDVEVKADGPIFLTDMTLTITPADLEPEPKAVPDNSADAEDISSFNRE